MKKIFLTALLMPAITLAQTYPSPTFNNLTLQNPLSASSGGTGTTTSTGSGAVVLSTSPSLTTPNLGAPSSVTLTNGTGLPVSTGISGLGTGVATGLANAATGSGSPVLATSPSISGLTVTGSLTATGLITTADHASQAANTVLANATSSTASPTAISVPNCNTSASALTWASGTGFACNTGVVASNVSGVVAITNGGTNSTTATGATGNLQYLQGSTGSVTQSLTSKFQQEVSVCDFGGCGGGDVSSAFQNAVNALPAAGGKIDVPDAAYTVNTAPTWGSKSVMWNFGPNATVSGTQTTFPRMSTNSAQIPVGPWIQSQSTVASPSNGGIAALNVEMLQPSPYVGQSVALYAGASGSSSNTGSNVWAINNLIQANTGAAGIYQGIEADVNDFASAAEVRGITVTGVGTQTPAYGMHIDRVSGPNWNVGINLSQFNTGIQLGTGITFPNTLISGNQTANGNDNIVLQRVTDTSPSGTFIRGVNAANSANMFNIDVSGNASFNGALSAGSISTSGAITPSTTAGIVGVTNGSAAASGSVGEVKDTFTSSSVAMSNATSTNVASETLTSGDWDVTCNVTFTGAASTTFSDAIVGVSTTSATTPPNVQFARQSFTTSAAPIWSLMAPTVPVNVSTSTPVYCVGYLSFANSTATAVARIHARRMH
ncbi:hypothetical protein PQR37_10350 [Paraburkholderia nemoris]|uniref:hypothetical protein n=1 Tax=Paraburkholderia TaxID=1822464 RepID=UPI0038BCCDFE